MDSRPTHAPARVALACVAAIALAPRAAWAGAAGVSITIDPCVGVAAPYVERVVSAELSGEGARDATPVDVRVTCRDGLVVVVATTRDAEPIARNVDLEHEDSPARPRVLSVAIAELVATVRARPARPPPKPPEPLPPPPPAAEPIAPSPAPPPRARPWSLGVASVARGFSALSGFGGGAWASFLSRAAHVGFRADVDGADGRSRVALGSVDARMASLGAQAIAGATWRALTVEGGAGLRVGLVSLAGHPDAGAVGHTVTGAWGGPLGLATAAWGLAPAWSVVATGEGGWVAREASGLVGGAPGVSIQGGWWCAALGLAWSP